MAVLVVVETPGHEHFQDQEYQDGCDVVLHREDVVPMLEIQESPEDAYDEVGDGDAAVEGQLRYLGGGQFSVGVTEGHDGLVLDVGCEGVCSDAVVARLERNLLCIVLVGVVDGLLLPQIDGLGADEVLRLGFVVVGEDPLSSVGGIAQAAANALVVADVGELQSNQPGSCEGRDAMRPTSSPSCFPSSGESFHSHTMTLTVGSLISLFLSVSTNLTSMNGSIGPPQDFLLYMPKHFCWSSWVCTG